MEFIIENVTDEEIVLLENARIDYCFDDFFDEDNRDIVVDSEEEYNRAISALSR